MEKFRSVHTIPPIRAIQLKKKFPVQVKDDSSNDFMGVKRLFDSSHSRLYKCMWLVIIVACLGGCLYQSSLRVALFLNHSTTLEVKLEPQLAFVFPSITLCSLRLEYWLTTNKSEYAEEKSHYATGFANTSELWKSITIKSEDLTITSDDWETSESINTSMLLDYVNMIGGQCIILTKKEKMKYKGPYTSIEITWTRSQDEEKYVFFIHNGSYHHVHDGVLMAETPLTLYRTNYRIQAKEYVNLNTYTHPCISEEEAIKCYNQCIDKRLAMKISCGLPFINSSHTQCSTLDKTIEAYKSIYTNYLSGTEITRGCECKRKCTEIKYTLNKDSEMKAKAANTTILKLLFADDKRSILTEREIVTASGLFSEIGGTMGLYLGISIFAIIELIESHLRKCCR